MDNAIVTHHVHTSIAQHAAVLNEQVLVHHTAGTPHAPVAHGRHGHPVLRSSFSDLQQAQAEHSVRVAAQPCRKRTCCLSWRMVV